MEKENNVKYFDRKCLNLHRMVMKREISEHYDAAEHIREYGEHLRIVNNEG